MLRVFREWGGYGGYGPTTPLKLPNPLSPGGEIHAKNNPPSPLFLLEKDGLKGHNCSIYVTFGSPNLELVVWNPVDFVECWTFFRNSKAPLVK